RMTSERELRFNSDGRFRILMVSDFHAGDKCNPKLIAGLEELVKASGPDFVMLGGDQCVEGSSAAGIRDRMGRIMEPVISRDIPWGAVFGNHDREGSLSIELQQEAYELLPGCMSEAGPADIHGVGNYCLTVKASRSDEPAFIIWALDSGREMRDWTELFGLDPDEAVFKLPNRFGEHANGATPLFDQARWYYDRSLEFERAAGKPVPGVMFMHIPLQEYTHVIQNPEECGAVGSKRASLDNSEISSGLFLACLERRDVRGIFFGHEHLTDIEGRYCGITMACDACLGYDMSGHDDLRGGRIIDLYEDEGKLFTRTLKLIDLMGVDAMRDPDYFEGGCKYFIRVLD
nr:metallophosphoesterase [Clostridia bacterium]